MQLDYITHYYLPGVPPFRSLSALSDEEALPVMRALYADNIFGMRFKNPLWYIRARRETEAWVRETFAARGGNPREPYPVYFVLGRSNWIENGSGVKDTPSISIPLSVFAEGDISFTYPDSMLSRWLAADQPEGMYVPELHGRVFTRTEILALVEQRGLPEEWGIPLPPDLAPYVEAQVWNHAVLKPYLPSPDQAFAFHGQP